MHSMWLHTTNVGISSRNDEYRTGDADALPAHTPSAQQAGDTSRSKPLHCNLLITQHHYTSAPYGWQTTQPPTVSSRAHPLMQYSAPHAVFSPSCSIQPLMQYSAPHAVFSPSCSIQPPHAAFSPLMQYSAPPRAPQHSDTTRK
jgi:hypothetical protein